LVEDHPLGRVILAGKSENNTNLELMILNCGAPNKKAPCEEGAFSG
jgi:hypothetical protein